MLSIIPCSGEPGLRAHRWSQDAARGRVTLIAVRRVERSWSAPIRLAINPRSPARRRTAWQRHPRAESHNWRRIASCATPRWATSPIRMERGA